VTEVLPVAGDQHGAPDLAALRDAVAAILDQGRAVNIVYAPTTITHQVPSAELVGMDRAEPARAAYPVTLSHGRTQGHPGIDVDLTGDRFELPAFVAPLPEVPTSRSWAPLVLLVSGWSGLGAVFAAAMTGGNAFAIGCAALALVVSGAAFCVVYRENR
jgi:hypothetical protein